MAVAVKRQPEGIREIIAGGDYATVSNDPDVREAYMGTSDA